MLKLCTICARGGSKGVKNKNIREIMGKPLISYTISQAINSGVFDSIAVSSDSELILKIAESYGVDYTILRPEHLSTDQAAKIPVIQHCVTEVERQKGEDFDLIVDLDVTSPLRLNDDIINAVNLLIETNAPNVITGSPARRSPYFNLVELIGENRVKLSKIIEQPIVRRQDAPKCYDMNASVYVWRRKFLLEYEKLFHTDTRIYVMPEERSIDIDSELDFEIVEYLLRKRMLDV